MQWLALSGSAINQAIRASLILHIRVSSFHNHCFVVGDQDVVQQDSILVVGCQVNLI